jgi:hypothetical protein
MSVKKNTADGTPSRHRSILDSCFSSKSHPQIGAAFYQPHNTSCRAVGQPQTKFSMHTKSRRVPRLSSKVGKSEASATGTSVLFPATCIHLEESLSLCKLFAFFHDLSCCLIAKHELNSMPTKLPFMASGLATTCGVKHAIASKERTILHRSATTRSISETHN